MTIVMQTDLGASEAGKSPEEDALQRSGVRLAEMPKLFATAVTVKPIHIENAPWLLEVSRENWLAILP